MKELQHEKAVDKTEFDKHLMDESKVDPVQMLIEDHNHVKGNFESFEQSSDEGKEALLKDTLLALVVHTKLEEELIYPVMKKVDEDLIGEAEEEHHVADFLITELKSMTVENEKLDSKFKVLGELVKHHIKEEEEELFPKLRKLDDIDFEELALNMVARKRELKEKYDDLKKIEPVKTEGLKQSRSSAGSKEGGTKKKAVAKKSTAKKSSIKATTKKTPAKKSSTKATAKKSPAKKSSTKATAKKTPAKKSSTKATAKKTPAKKSIAKRATVKKASAKPAAKKSTRKSASGSSRKGR